MRMRKVLLALAISGGAVASAFSADAADTPYTENGSHVIGPYDAKGLPLGGFRLFPTLDLSVSSDDNIYRTQTGTKNDTYFTEDARVRLESQWSTHELNLFAGFATSQYSNFSSEDHTDWNVGGNGRLDIVRGADIIAGSSYSVLHESRTSPDQPGVARKPTEYALTLANAAIEYHPYHFGFSAGGAFARYQFDPTSLIGFPFILSNSDRDRDEYTVFGKASYEFSPGYALFVLAQYDDRQFDLSADRNGLHRDSNGTSIDAGLDILLGHLVKGQVFAGYLKQNYTAPLKDVTGFNYGVNLTWSPSPLWTFRLAGARTLRDTTINFASAEDQRTIAGGVDWEFMRNVTVQGDLGYSDSRFTGSPRDDQVMTGSLGVKYFMNSNMNAKFSYIYQHRNSSIALQDFTDNTFQLDLRLQL